MWLATWAARSRVRRFTELAPPLWIWIHEFYTEVICKFIFTEVHMRNNYHPNWAIHQLKIPKTPDIEQNLKVKFLYEEIFKKKIKQDLSAHTDICFDM